jgi:hypothetical protein
MAIIDQHYALIIIPLFITQAPTCFGTYVPSSGSVLYPCELLESPKWMCHRDVPLYCECWWPVCTGCCSFVRYLCPAERIRKFIYVQFKVQLDVLFYVILLFFILSSTCFGCYLHPSSAAQLQHTAIGVCMVLVCSSIRAGTIIWDTLTLLARSNLLNEPKRLAS